MMNYILGIIILLIAVILLSYFLKKKHFKEIDRIEKWKMEIMNRPILDELSKVKQLNMTGETEEMFEQWRNEWDAIITIHMPDVEEMLFEAEDYVDKYHLNKSKGVQRKIGAKLTGIEDTIQMILAQLNELVGSEEKNRMEIEGVKESYRKIKKQLLAHRHIYGQAADRLESLLDEVLQTLREYEEATENGNYLNARQLVLAIKSKLTQIEAKMEALPQLLIEVQSALPSLINELKDGFREMLDSGYLLNHIEFNKELADLEEEIEHYENQLNIAETENAAKGIQDVSENVNVLYDLLEKEVLSKQYLLENEQVLKGEMEELEYERDKLKAETAVVLHSYHLADHELEAHRNLDKQIVQLTKRFQALTLKIFENNSSNSVLSEQMQEIGEQLKEVKIEQTVFLGKLQALRKDELEARETLKELRLKMVDTTRIITKSNIPGLPEDYKTQTYEAKEIINDVQVKLEEKPLDMASVHIFLEKAVESVDGLHQNIEGLVEQMYLAEKVIQYGNRYRSRYPSISEALKNAEQKFREYGYEEALSIAATAIEKIEPGSLKKIEANLEEVLS